MSDAATSPCRGGCEHAGPGVECVCHAPEQPAREQAAYFSDRCGRMLEGADGVWVNCVLLNGHDGPCVPATMPAQSASVSAEQPARGPTWVDGIGPPLEQIAADHTPPCSQNDKDVLALIAEVVRLRAPSGALPSPVSAALVTLDEPAPAKLKVLIMRLADGETTAATIDVESEALGLADALLADRARLTAELAGLEKALAEEGDLREQRGKNDAEAERLAATYREALERAGALAALIAEGRWATNGYPVGIDGARKCARQLAVEARAALADVGAPAAEETRRT